MKVGLSVLFLEVHGKSLNESWEIFHHPSVFELVDNGILAIGEHMSKLKDLCSVGFSFTVHGPYDGINIASLNEERRIRSLRAHMKSMERASELQALCYVIHPGKLEDRRRLKEQERINTESLETLLDHASSLGLKVGVENGNPPSDPLTVTPEDFEDLRLPIVLDIGHAFISSTLEDFIRKMKHRIVEVHFHDNSGTSDDHLCLDDGQVPWRRVAWTFKDDDVLGIVESVHRPYMALEKLNAALI
jgi:sugar phosphate isomerase/epimerase